MGYDVRYILKEDGTKVIEKFGGSLSDNKDIAKPFSTYDDFLDAVDNDEIKIGQRCSIEEGIYKNEDVKTHLTDITSGTLLDNDVAGAKAVDELNSNLSTLTKVNTRTLTSVLGGTLENVVCKTIGNIAIVSFQLSGITFSGAKTKIVSGAPITSYKVMGTGTLYKSVSVPSVALRFTIENGDIYYFYNSEVVTSGDYIIVAQFVYTI